MVIYFGADHRGFELKEHLKTFTKNLGYEFVDVGAAEKVDGDDYPDYAKEAAKHVSENPEGGKAIVLCGSGAGVCVTANKFPHIRATLGLSPDQIYDARHDDDVNVLCIASDFISQEDAEKITRVFLETPFAPEERFVRRLQKIEAIEQQFHA